MAKVRNRNLAKELAWRKRLAAWDGSGLSIKAFCAREGVSAWQFHYWRSEIRKRDEEESGPGGVTFREIQLPEDRGRISIQCGRYAVNVTRGFDAGVLKEVLAVLEGAGC